jgi:hypothetical protein
LIEFYELAHARRMTHFQAFGNPFVAHSEVVPMIRPLTG